MQCVILAAGRGTRMGELATFTPKPMLEVAGKTLLKHKFETLPPTVEEVILVVGYLGDIIRKHFGSKHNGKKILYIEQKNPEGGTADALWSAQDVLFGKFLVMNGDDLYGREDVWRMVEESGWSVGGIETEESTSAAKMIIDEKGFVKVIEEGGGYREGKGYINTGLYLLDTSVFELTPIPKSATSKELGLPQTLIASKRPLRLVPIVSWISITTPFDLQNAENLLAKRRLKL